MEVARMIRYHRVDPHYWVLAKNWDDRTRNVVLYVQTCRHRVTEGLFPLPKAYMAADLGYTVPQVARSLGVIVNAGLVKYDDQAEVIFICNALEMQAPTTPKQIQGAIARLRMVPASPLLCDLHFHANAHANAFAEAIREAFPTLGLRNGAVPFESSNSSSRSKATQRGAVES
jgi:hypothetical protein